jgi:hypothetical protein
MKLSMNSFPVLRHVAGGRLTSWAVGGVVAAGLLIAGAMSVGAVPLGSGHGGLFSPGNWPAVAGTVSTAPASATGSFTLVAWGGTTWTVDLSGSTTYSEAGVTSPTYSNVAVGDQVAVDGTTTAPDTVDAGSVWVSERPVVSGTVATAPASATGSFTLTTRGGTTWTVDLTGSTTYAERGVTSPTYVDVAVGDEVVVFGTSTGTDTVTAGSVTIMLRPVVRGTVATAPASSTGSFTVTAWKNQTWTVDLTGTTAYTERGVSSPNYSDVAAGDEVVVFGTSTATDTVTASSVTIMQRPVVQGTVATAPASATGSFTVTGWNKQTWTVDLSGSTTYLEHGVSTPTYSDVVVGADVVVYGTSAGSGTVDASNVVIMSAPPHPKLPPSPWAVSSELAGPTTLSGFQLSIGGTVSSSDRGGSSSDKGNTSSGSDSRTTGSGPRGGTPGFSSGKGKGGSDGSPH